MNKKGEFILRDMLVMLVIFAGIMTFMTIFVVDMADKYGNDNMSSEYQGSEISSKGSSLLSGLKSNVSEMRNETEGGVNRGGIIGAFQTIGTGAAGVGSVIGIIFKIPVYFGNAIEAILNTLYIPDSVAIPIGDMVSIILYAVIILVIISALLRGPRL